MANRIENAMMPFLTSMAMIISKQVSQPIRLAR